MQERLGISLSGGVDTRHARAPCCAGGLAGAAGAAETPVCLPWTTMLLERSADAIGLNN